MSLTNGLKKPPSSMIILGALALTLLPVSSHAIVFDFESETVQIGQSAVIVTVDLMTATITRTPNTAATLGVVDPQAFGTAPVAFGNRSLLPDAGFPNDSLLVTFSSPTRLVRVNFGDAAGDDDSLVVITTNTGVSSSAVWSSADIFTRDPVPADYFGTLEVYDPAGFTSVTLTSGSDGSLGYTGDTTLFWDNLEVPEPTTILLLGVGLGALALHRRRRNG